MIISKIHIQNYRAYKEFECEFSGGINLVIGDNGSGKTSLLAALSQLLSVQVSRFNGGGGIEPTDPHVEVEKIGDATFSVKECFPINISGKVQTDDNAVAEFTVIRKDMYNSSYQGDTYVIGNLIEKDGSVLPLISYQRFDRDWKLGKNTSGTISVETGLNERRDGYKECLVGLGQEEKIQKWCLKMSLLEFEKRKSIKEFSRFKSIIKTFLQAIEDSKDDFEVNYSTDFSGLVMKKGDIIQPLYEMSTGYKALLSMIMELAYRAVLLNPTTEMGDHDQTGVVVIDEIDAHLHPKWQWRVIDALEKCFPKVQFIIATHSPMVIASAKNARLIDLGERGQLSYSEGAYGYNVSDVLELKQGSSSKTKISAKYMEELENAMDDGNKEEAERVAENAKLEFGENSPIYGELRDYIEVNRWIEE